MRKALIASVLMLICTLAAMAISPSRHENKVMSPFKFKAEQPQKFSRQSNLTTFIDLTSEVEKERLAKKGIRVLKSFNNMISEADSITSAKVSMHEDETTHILTVNLLYDKEEVKSLINAIAFPNYTEDDWFFYESVQEAAPESIEFVLPPGSYDIIVIFETSDMSFIILTASAVEMTNNQEICLNSNDATIDIAWNAIMPDGTIPYVEANVYEPETFEVIDHVNGDAILINNNVSIRNKKHKGSISIEFQPMTVIVGDSTIETRLGNIRSMPNEDYGYYFEKNIITQDGGYFILLDANAVQSCFVTNDINNYVTLKPEFSETPYQPQPMIFDWEEEYYSLEFDKNKTFCLNLANIENNQFSSLSTMGIFGAEDEIKKWIHVCQNPLISNEYKIMPIPTLLEDWEINYSTTGLPIDLSLISPVAMAINNSADFNSYMNLPNNWNLYLADITNYWLSFDASKPYKWNYGCPIIVFSPINSEWGSFFNFTYIGRLGERRSIDLLTTEASVSVNDMAPSDDILENLQWGQLPDEGRIELEFIDTNVAIDGISGKNIARVGFDMAHDDWEPPTLQIVRFVDTVGNFTDRYATGKDGIIEFYGGDFTYHYNSETYADWYTEEPAAEVKVEYAPYGTDSFLPIEVENIPERDFMPGFGTYYRGSLAGVDRKSENGWFDVRITLIDAAGNYQEQTLSPAFKIEESVGVETVTSPEIAVSVTNGTINVCGCENPVIEIYTPDGVLLSRIVSSTIDATEFVKGIYLINVTDGSHHVFRKIRL